MCCANTNLIKRLKFSLPNSENLELKGSHLIDVYVVEVRRVVDGFEEALELAGGSSVDHQDEGDPHRFERVALPRVLVPLDVGVGLTCEAGQGHVYWCQVAEGEGG